MKRFIYSLICCILSAFVTFKLTLMFFEWNAATNNTTAPIAAFLVCIPVGFMLFHVTVKINKFLIKELRLFIKKLV